MSNDKALRYNKGKIEVTQCADELVCAVATVFMKNDQRYGGKYPTKNWSKGAPYSELINCLERHLKLFKSGVDIDEESGLPHVFLIAANIQMLVFNTIHHKENDDRDKRFPLDFKEFTKYLEPKKEESFSSDQAEYDAFLQEMFEAAEQADREAELEQKETEIVLSSGNDFYPDV